MRKFHQLAPNHSREKPRRFVFLDTESVITEVGHDREHRLKLGVARYVRIDENKHAREDNELVFRSVDELWDWVVARVPRRTKLYLVAHNWSFDWLIIDGHRQLEARGYKLLHFYQKSMVTMLTYRGEDRTIKVIDDMNLFPMSLRALGANIGTDKGIVNFDSVSDEELVAYCRQDVQVMIDAWQSWLSFLQTYDMGNFAPTLASQAFNAYRHRYMHYPIFIHADPEATELERASYHGGRTEVFRVGEYSPGPFYKLDVNAMYPYVMKDNLFPSKLKGISHKTSVDHLARLLDKFALVARVRVAIVDPVFPTHINLHRCYPVGTFDTTLTTPELAYAFEWGIIEHVYSVAVYEQQLLFRDWVEFIYGLEQRAKCEGDSVLRFQCKLLRNSLYGKFGQRDLEREMIGDAQGEGLNQVITYVASDSTEVREYNFLDKRWQDVQGPASFNAFVAIASHVTAQARLQLWSYIQQAGREHVYYVDTDSLIVDAEGFANLSSFIDPGRLGYLKLEGEASRIVINAPKDYTFGDDTHLKGISRDAERISDTVWSQQQWPSLGTAYQRQQFDLVHTRGIEKHLNRTIFSGTVQADGWVTPHRVTVNDDKLTVISPSALSLAKPVAAS